jgi:serine/threonine-protein kinase RsbW
MTLELQATPQEVMRAVDALRSFAQQYGIDEKAVFGVTVALEECASNIVDHTFNRNAQQKFRVQFEMNGESISVELRDRGPHFDPTSVPARNRSEEETGGWGIQIVRRHTDDVQYRREGGENILTLKKKVLPANAPK